MLTSMYYYQHYKPYMIKTADSPNKIARPQKDNVQENPDNIQNEVALNKALTKDVIDYAKGIYKNTTDLRYMSKKLAGDIRNYEKYRAYEEFNQEVFEENFGDDLKQFTDSYNRSCSFLKSQQHSKVLGEAAEKMERILGGSEKILGVLGIKKDKDGNIKINGDDNRFWNGKNTVKKAEAAEKLFSQMHDETAEILNNPMSKHMDFKSLNYYYNYEVDRVQVDSFQIIKTGLLVNLAL